MRIEALQYHFKHYLRQIGNFGLIFLGLIVATFLIDYLFADRVEIVYGGIEFIFIIFCFVLSLTEYRKNLRFMLQVGVSRQTTWFATLLSMAVSAAGLALVWTLYSKGIGSFNPQGVVVLDVYKALYHDISSITIWLLNAISFIMVYFLGLCINLIYAHLEKPGIIAVSVGVPIGINLLFLLDGVGGMRVMNRLFAFGKWFSLTWVNAFAFYLGLLIVFMIVSYLLNRRLSVIKEEMV